MFDKRKILKRSKGAEEVELRFERWSRGPQYKIRILKDGKYEDLGITTISSSEEKGRKKIYSSSFGTYGGNQSEWQRINFGNSNSFEEARQLAYRKTQELAQEIADRKGVRLEDKVDDDKLADEIENPWKKNYMPFFILIIIAGFALSLTQLSITGNAISNLIGTTPGILGVLLFIAGLVGMFFSLRK